MGKNTSDPHQQEAPLRLDPKVDLVFKALFAAEHNRDILLELLNGVLGLLGHAPLVEVQILTPFTTVEAFKDMVGTVDLAVRDDTGAQYIIEMQCQYRRSFPERMLYYGARRYGDQLRAGEGYGTLRPVLVLVFTNFALLRESPDYAHHFELRGIDRSGKVGPEVFSPHLRIVTIELPKFVPSQSPTSHHAPPLGEQWIEFLKEGDDMATQPAPPWETPALRKAREELSRLAADPAMRELYEHHLRQTQLLATELHESYEDGRLVALRDTIASLLRIRFGEDADSLHPLIHSATEADALAAVPRALMTRASLEDVRALLEAAAPR